MANEEPVVKAFNKALFSLKDSKAAISKQKIVEVTKTAMNALRFYKHVVLIVEKFIQKCDPILKVPSFYIIDSIVRQGIKQHKEKDVFGPRFALNLTKTLEKGLECSEEDKLKIVRVINLWRTHNVFQPNVIDSLLNYCRSIGLDVDVKSVEMKVKGDKANMKIYSQEDRKSKRSSSPQTPPKQNEQQSSQEVAHSDVAPLNGISEKEISERLQQTFPQWALLIDSNQETFQRFSSLVNEFLKERVDREKANQGANISSILTQDFEYSDDEDEKQQKVEFNVPKDKIESMVNEIFSDANFRASTAGIYTSTLTANKPPQLNQFPDVSNIFANKPPPMPVSNPWHPFQPNVFLNPFAPDQNTIPMPVQSPVKSQQSDSIKTDSSRRSKHDRKRDRSPDNRSSDRKRHHRSRSPSVSEKDKERERRRLGLPNRPRDEHTIIASKTLWFGRLPTNCSEHDIRNSVKDSADPQRINIISSRACAYVTFPDRRSAYKIIDRLHRDIKVNGRNIKLEWATSSSIQKGDKIMDFWDKERGYFNIPHRSLPHDLAPLLESNHLDVATLPSHMKGKYTESGPIEKDEAQEAIQNIQPPVEIPLPSSTQLPQGLLQFPPNISADGSTPTLPNFPPLGLPGFLQPNLLAVLAQQQQQAAPAFENLFNALQQNPGAGILPNLGQAPNIFSNIPFDNNVTESQGSEPQPFQSKFNNARGNFQPRFRGGFRGNDRGSSFRPRFNNRGQNGEFRPRGRGRGDRSGEFRPHRGNFNNANFQPLPQFMPNNGIGLNIGNLPLAQSLIGAGITTSLQPPTNNELNESNDMEIDNQTENSLSA